MAPVVVKTLQLVERMTFRLRLKVKLIFEEFYFKTFGFS